MLNENRIQVLIIGAGPAGLSAAIAAKESGVDRLLVLEREDQPGGILQQCIHNGFGLHRFSEELTGPEYASRDIETCRKMGIEIRTGTTVLSVSRDRKVTAISKSRGLEIFDADAVVMAMGCRERPRGALATPGTRCAGIYSAGTAQKYINLMGYMPGKRVVILGSGDIGLIMARRMTLQGAKVLACVELMPYSSGLNRNIVQCLNDYGIPLYLEHTVTDIRGRERLEGVTVARVDQKRQPIPGTEMDFECDTLLLSVGLIPENELARECGVPLCPATSGAYVDERLQTEIPGVFACGNVLHVHDLVDFVSEESYRAGKAAAAFALGKTVKTASTVAVRDGFGVRGTVPQRIGIPENREEMEPVHLMFRTGNVFRNCAVVLQADGEEIFRQKKRILTPGEMVDLKLPLPMMERLGRAETLTVSVDVNG